MDNNFKTAVNNWAALSGLNPAQPTVTGEFLGVMKQLGNIGENISKIFGTIENTIKIFGL